MMEELLKTFREASTSNISDALDRLSIRGGCEGVLSQVDAPRMVGTAFTVRYVPADPVSKGSVGDFLDDVKSGEVVVIDNGGRTYCTVWGNIMTFAAARKGIAGTVIDGVCRDLEEVKTMQYPIFSRGRYMMTGKDRVQVEAVGEPISISGVHVKPGDIVVGDDSGVIVVPNEVAEKVMELVREVSNTEALIIEDLQKGLSLKEARARHRYHTLQRPIQ
jgi:4-hydroxy-4-methyl-2-oxoglutarate aldolase